MQQLSSTRSSRSSSTTRIRPDGGARLPPPPGRTLRRARALKLFCASYNLGEAAPPAADELRRWLPRGRDVYCVALQECLAPDAFAAALCAAVDGDYVLSRRSLGSARKDWHHGHRSSCSSSAATSRRWRGRSSPSRTRLSAVAEGARHPRSRRRTRERWARRAVHGDDRLCGRAPQLDKRGVSKLEKRIRDTRYVYEGIELGFDALAGLEACVHRDPPRRSQLPRRAAARPALERMARPLGVAPRRRRTLDRDGAATRPQRLARGADRLPPPYRRRPAVARAAVAVGDADEDGGDGLGATAGRRSLSDAGAAVAALEAARCVDGSEAPSYTDRVLLHPCRARAAANVRRLRRVRAADGVGPRPVAADLVLSVPQPPARPWRRHALPRRHSLVVRGGSSLRCQLRLGGSRFTTTTPPNVLPSSRCRRWPTAPPSSLR